MIRVKKTIRLDEDVIKLLDREEASTGKSRSQIVNDAIRAEFKWRVEVSKIFDEAFATHRREVLEWVAQSQVAAATGIKAILDDRHKEQNARLEEILDMLKNM